jgi:hypothetical protein
MKYVSARYQLSPLQPSDPQIVATGDDGQVYYIPSLDCDVPPWPEYLAEGGEVVALEEPSPPSIYQLPEEEPDAAGSTVEPEPTK